MYNRKKPPTPDKARQNLTDSDIPQVFLKMGEVHISAEPTVITTVLGSCISVTMFNRRLAIGGMCHGFLPYCRDNENCAKNSRNCFRFVDCSVGRMVEQFRMRGVMPREIEVKMFGGASIFERIPGASSLSVGDQNVESAKRAIAEAGLNLVSFDVGGLLGRRILFYTHTGRVLLKELKSTGKEL